MAGGGSRTTTQVAALLARARPRARGVAAGGVALAVATPLAFAAALGGGHAERLLDLTSGTAWVVSPARGLVTLLDGGSEDVVAGVRVPGTALTVAQAGAGAYLVDDDAGTVSRLDAATFTASTPVALGTPGGGLAVLQNDPGPGGRHVVHVLDPRARTAARVDPRTLAVHGEVTLTAQPGPGQAVVDDAGDLWVLDAPAGTVTRVAADDAGRTVRRSDAATATARLVLVQGSPVLVDPAAGSARTVGPDARTGPARCVDTRPADDVEVLGSTTRDELYVAVAQARSLLVTSTAGGDRAGCGRAVDLGGPGDDPEYGRLAQSGRYVFVPDTASGTTAVVDTAAGDVLDHVALTDPGHRLELRAQDGFVFFNDLDGHAAGVLTLRGGRWSPVSLEKYDPATGEGAQVVVPQDERPPVTEGRAAGPDDADDPPAGPAAPDARPTAPSEPAGPRAGAGPDVPRAGPGSAPRPAPAPTASPPVPAPTTPAPHVTVTLGTDPPSSGHPEFQPFTPATVAATVTGAGADATWAWQVTSGSPDQPAFTPPAPGDPLVLDSVGGGDVTVRLTVTDGDVSGTAELLLWVTYACHVTINGSGSGDAHVVDLTSAASGTFTVEAHECREPPTVSVDASGHGWMSVSPPSVTVPADGSAAVVTVTQTGAGGGTGVVRVTFHGTSGDQVYDVQVLPDEPPVVVDATVCRATTALREDGRTVGTRVTTVVGAVVLDGRVGGAERHTVTGDDGRALAYVGSGGGSGEHAYRVTEVVDIRLDDPAPPPDPPGPAASITAADGYGAASTAGTRTTTDCG